MRLRSLPARLLSVLLAVTFAGSCATPEQQCRGSFSASDANVSNEAKPMSPAELSSLENELVAKHGEAQRVRIHRGLTQISSLWRASDGDLAAFAREQFIADDALLAATRDRLEQTFEQLDGHSLEMSRALRWPSDVDVGPLLPVDPLLGAYEPAAHMNEDLFASKIAFVVLLNWPLTTLAERTENAQKWSRAEWAAVRLAGRFQARIPGEVEQGIAKASADAELYISQYNVWAHHVLGPNGERLFPKGKRLITHWNLRDEIKADYAEGPSGLGKQRAIMKVMERIVTQTIPRAVIDNPRVDWNPFANTVAASPAAEVEDDAPKETASLPVDVAPEPDTRYARWLAQFQANEKADPYSPTAPTLIARTFEIQRELPQERVEQMLTQVLTSPVAAKVAGEIQKRVGRPLEPQDIWFDGFKARSKIPEAQLDELTRKRYPNAEAFAKDMPRILGALGFSPEKAKFIAERVRVDPSRGAGHALQAERRGDFPHLRTRIEKNGMDYKGYNIAIHEFGHNVEQVFSLYEVDHTLLAGVPNNAFTEALAFVFQKRDLEVLGVSQKDPAAEREDVLSDFMQCWELAGVSLVDLRMWQWMYAHPDATPAQLKDETVRVSREVWNQYYAPLLGGKDSVLLAVYSHMISYPLYLADYPIGRMISAQVEEQFKTSGKPLGEEFERIASYGSVTPDAWMIHATGKPVGPEALLRASEEALRP